MHDLDQFLSDIALAFDRGEIDTPEGAQRVVRYVRSHIDCALVSYWLLEGHVDDHSRTARRIACEDIDDASANVQTLVLNQEQCSAYFDAIEHAGTFVSNDALSDERLVALRDVYLVPNHICSTLCASITVNGEVLSVISCSQRLTPRQWTPGEITALRRLASQISVRRVRRRAKESGAETMAQVFVESFAMRPAG